MNVIQMVTAIKIMESVNVLMDMVEIHVKVS